MWNYIAYASAGRTAPTDESVTIGLIILLICLGAVVSVTLFKKLLR